MQILVTGGSGYVGSVLSLALQKAGHDVTVYDTAEPVPGLRWLEGDVCRPPDGKWDAVVHLAAIVGETACAADPVEAKRTNIRGTEAMLNVNARRFVFFSTCSNYGRCDGEADEDAPLKPLSLYAETKIAGERLVQAWGGVVLRFATICGRSPRTRYDLLVNELARNCRDGKPSEIRDPKAWRPFVHIGDVAPAVILAVEKPLAEGGIFNVVGENIQKRGLASIVQQRFPGASISIQNGAKDRRDYRVSGERARRVLGFTPQRTIRQAFDEVAGSP